MVSRIKDDIETEDFQNRALNNRPYLKISNKFVCHITEGTEDKYTKMWAFSVA
jgi:hypothetical protein